MTGPGRRRLRQWTILSGKQVAVRDKSIQFESLDALNAQFKSKGKPPIDHQDGARRRSRTRTSSRW